MSTSERGRDCRQQLKIDIISDNICPWCYIGKRRLEKALDALDRSKIEVRVAWFPFELDPTLPRDGSLVKLERYKQKFGPSFVEQRLPQMIATGKQEGINFSFGGKIGSTFDSHRLLHYVKQLDNGETRQNALIDVLFRAYFEDEQDLSDHRVLSAAAKQIGLDSSRVEEFLRSDLFRKEVQEAIDRNQREGVTGVPHFRINDRTELSGAQSPHEFLRAFREAGLNF